MAHRADIESKPGGQSPEPGRCGRAGSPLPAKQFKKEPAASHEPVLRRVAFDEPLGDGARVCDPQPRSIDSTPLLRPGKAARRVPRGRERLLHLRTHGARPSDGFKAARSGFTLLELLVVIGIIGMLSAISLPAVKALTQSNVMASSNRQVLDDLALARHLAISGRRTVYMLFVPPNVVNQEAAIEQQRQRGRLTENQATRLRAQLEPLKKGQYTTYALFSRRSVGDQPGQGTPQYLSEWKTLPQGMFINTRKFTPLSQEEWLGNHGLSPEWNPDRPLPYAAFPFPAEAGPPLAMPYIAFDANGRVTYAGGLEPRYPRESVVLARGGIFYLGEDRGIYEPDVQENPPGDRTEIRVDWLTGRAEVQKPQMQ